MEFIKSKGLSVGQGEFISIDAYLALRSEQLRLQIADEKGALTKLEKEVMDSINADELLSADLADEQSNSSYGEKLSDKIASFGGSWAFIIAFFLVIIAWILANSVILSNPSFDPYPFILLNLILSCIAAVQAPIIMMSQNRQESRDRLRSKNDYKVNLKSEMEIRMLHEKVDFILHHQGEHLHELQSQILELNQLLVKQLGK
jgi:uncharacterized membrane protein